MGTDVATGVEKNPVGKEANESAGDVLTSVHNCALGGWTIFFSAGDFARCEGWLWRGIGMG
jgi:hypothetical protein